MRSRTWTLFARVPSSLYRCRRVRTTVPSRRRVSHGRRHDYCSRRRQLHSPVVAMFSPRRGRQPRREPQRHREVGDGSPRDHVDGDSCRRTVNPVPERQRRVESVSRHLHTRSPQSEHGRQAVGRDETQQLVADTGDAVEQRRVTRRPVLGVRDGERPPLAGTGQRCLTEPSGVSTVGETSSGQLQVTVEVTGSVDSRATVPRAGCSAVSGRGGDERCRRRRSRQTDGGGRGSARSSFHGHPRSEGRA